MYDHKNHEPMTEPTLNNYPNVSQSFGITGIVILGMLLLSPVNFLLAKFFDKEISTLVYYLVGIGIPLWIVYSIRKRKSDNHSFNLEIKNNRIIPFVTIGALALLIGVISPIGNLIPIPESFKKIFMEIATRSSFFTFTLMVIAAPILEELIFRGIILDGLLKNYSPFKSILISSLLFGLVHLNPWQFVTGFILGIFSGWVYYKTRSLLPTIIMHAAVNLFGFSMRFFFDSKLSINDSLVEIYGGITNLTFAIGISIIIFVSCIYYLKKEFKKDANMQY